MKDRNRTIKTEFDFHGYHVVIQRKSKNKNSYLRLQSDGSILVTAPYHLTDETIIEYLHRFVLKLENKYQVEDFQKISYNDGGQIILLGKKYQLKIKTSNKNYVKVNADDVEVYVKDKDDLIIKKTLDKFLLQRAKIIINERFDYIMQIFHHIDFIPELKVKKLKARFGCCYYKKNKIIISSELIHYDLDCLDYVIIHELAHFEQPNHSKKFYYLVEGYLPNYREAEKKLKHRK